MLAFEISSMAGTKNIFRSASSVQIEHDDDDEDEEEE